MEFVDLLVLGCYFWRDLWGGLAMFYYVLLLEVCLLEVSLYFQFGHRFVSFGFVQLLMYLRICLLHILLQDFLSLGSLSCFLLEQSTLQFLSFLFSLSLIRQKLGLHLDSGRHLKPKALTHFLYIQVISSEYGRQHILTEVLKERSIGVECQSIKLVARVHKPILLLVGRNEFVLVELFVGELHLGELLGEHVDVSRVCLVQHHHDLGVLGSLVYSDQLLESTRSINEKGVLGLSRDVRAGGSADADSGLLNVEVGKELIEILQLLLGTGDDGGEGEPLEVGDYDGESVGLVDQYVAGLH